MRACLISLTPRSPAAVMTPMVPMVPAVPVAPAHLGGCLLRIVLDRGGGAGTDQRHRLRTLRWSSQDEQRADGGKAQKSRDIHAYFSLGVIGYRVGARLLGAGRNANCVNRFPSGTKTFFPDIFQNRHRLSPVSSESFPLQEIVMISLGTNPRILRFALATTSAIAGTLSAHAAFASQGPGGGPGTASAFTQLAMAIVVYGASALVVGAGLIGVVRRRSH